MGTKSRVTWKLVAILSALAVMLAVIPAGGAHLGESGDGEPPLLRLHVGTDGQYFQYEPVDGDPVRQNLPTPVNCELRNVNGPLAALSGNNRGPGIHGISIGVKSGGSQGVPCGRVDSKENLTLSLVGVPAAAKAELDLELKGGARVQLELYLGGQKTETFEVRAGAGVVAGEGVDGTPGVPFSALVSAEQPIANCQGQADSGPDAGALDNCRVTVHPTVPFDAIKFVPKMGEFSLEGSGDFGNDPAFDTIFYLSQFEGELDCGDEVSKDDGVVEATIIRHDNWDGTDCTLKPYTLRVNADDPEEEGAQTVTFLLSEDGQAAFYEAFLTFKSDSMTSLDGALLLQISFDPPFNVYEDLEACDEPPFVEGAPNVDAFPEEKEACVISVFQDWDGVTEWHIVFIADPKFR